MHVDEGFLQNALCSVHPTCSVPSVLSIPPRQMIVLQHLRVVLSCYTEVFLFHFIRCKHISSHNTVRAYRQPTCVIHVCKLT
jgi:hypothetical protein